MMLKPCAECGGPADGTYCGEHRPAWTERADRSTHPAHVNGGRWQRFSRRLRAMSPWCEFCGATERLSLDHIIPVSERPDLTYAEENCRILCLSCNGRRGDDPPTALERSTVENAIARRRRNGRPGRRPRVVVLPRPDGKARTS